MSNLELQEHLDKLSSDATYISIELDYIPPSKVKELLEELPDCDLKAWDDFETNGWDLDFWFTFKYKEKTFLFSGSWYYGNYTIKKKPE